MEPFALSLLSSAVLFGIKRWNDARKKRGGLSDPPVFSAAQIHGFTHLAQAGREFDHDFTAAVLGVLSQRGATLLSPKALGLPEGFRARVYKLGLPSEHLQSGADLIASAHAEGETVLGSLSLRMLTAGTKDDMLLVIGPAEVRGLAAPTQVAPDKSVHQGFFAILAKPRVGAEDAPSAAEATLSAEPAAAAPPVDAPTHANGATPAPPPIDMSKWERIPPTTEASG